MSAIKIKGTYRNGQIILTEPANWAEGTEVLVEPVAREPLPAAQEEDWPTNPESIARWIAEFEAIPPMFMAAEEEVQWQAARKARKDHELSQWDEHRRKIDELIP